MAHKYNSTSSNTKSVNSINNVKNTSGRMNVLESIIDKFHRSRRKPDLLTDKDNPRATATACVTTAIVGISKKTGTKASKIPRHRATGELINESNPSASIDVSVADAMNQTDIEKICRLPDRFDLNEWLATHILTLFDHINALCGTISEVCTPVTCHVMSYPGVSKANWVDDRGKRHNYSAMRYIDSVMSFCEASRKNQQIFPTKFGMTFSADFDAQCRRMIRLLWHCCGHLYDKHWDYICILSLRSQYSLVLVHLATIARLYDMLESKMLQPIYTIMHAIKQPTPSIHHEPSEFHNVVEDSRRQSKQPRPAKRLSSCNVDDESDSCGPTTSGVLAKATRTPLFRRDAGPLAHLFSGLTSAGGEALASFNRWQTSLTSIESHATVLPAMKSGSWGGHHSNSFQSANTVANTTRSFKNIVQTY